MREYSTPAAVDIPSSAGLTDVVFERAAGEPGRVVMRRKGTGGDGGWQDVTARQFAGDVTALAKGLIAAGIAAGDRVALMSRTRYEWTVLDTPSGRRARRPCPSMRPRQPSRSSGS